MSAQLEALALVAIGQEAVGLQDLHRALTDGIAERAWVDLLCSAQELELSSARIMQASVDLARAQGHTWASIGSALGTSRQAAHDRFRSIH